GLALVLPALPVDPALRDLLRPSLGKVGLGLALGLLMLAATELAFAWLAPRLPGLEAETVRLFGFLRGHAGGLPTSTAAQGGLIAVIAACEEILFRGVLLAPPPGPRPHPAERRALRVVALALVYALATATLGSPLLVACAFACGLAWGAMRAATGTLWVPILAHVVWDLGVLIVWPLVGRGR
ncbi:MAG: CPBP family intramembrane glutamic endopeptidase, partial [Deltaproteobacteria bacterium]